jgi:hypothetical protein
VDSEWTPLQPVPSKPDPMRERFPALARFFGLYFHQDWDIEAPDDQGLVRLFLIRAPDESTAEDVRRELDDFLSATPDADLDETLLQSFGCAYNPERHGLTTRAWLERVRGFLADG